MLMVSSDGCAGARAAFAARAVCEALDARAFGGRYRYDAVVVQAPSLRERGAGRVE